MVILKATHMKKEEPVLDKAELEYLKAGLRRSHKERFEYATLLYKVQQTMNKAIITHKPFIAK